MPMLEHYRDQAQLLIDVLPYVAQQKVFALKGGTARSTCSIATCLGSLST